MPAALRNTVDRLDKPSAYYLGKVCRLLSSYIERNKVLTTWQNKKRKYDRDRDEREERERTPEEPEDPLKDATTLYVGNLCALCLYFNCRSYQN